MPRPHSLGAYSPLQHTTNKHNTTLIFDQKGRADSEKTQIVVKTRGKQIQLAHLYQLTGLSWTNTGPRVRGDKHVANELKRAAQKHSVPLHDLVPAHCVRAKNARPPDSKWSRRDQENCPASAENFQLQCPASLEHLSRLYPSCSKSIIFQVQHPR